jgi:hypothetical protein
VANIPAQGGYVPVAAHVVGGYGQPADPYYTQQQQQQLYAAAQAGYQPAQQGYPAGYTGGY